MAGLIVLDYDRSLASALRLNLEACGATVLSARPRELASPFVTMTATLRRAAMASEVELTVVAGYELLRPSLALLHRMALRVIHKHAGILITSPATELAAVLALAATERGAQYAPALLHASRNIVGHVGRAKVLLVGERINPVYRRFEHWPFHAD